MVHEILFCEGNYYDIGRKQGESLAYAVRSNLATFWNVVRARGYNKREVVKQTLKLGRLWSLQRLEEIEGIGDGARVEYPELLAYNIYHDFAFPEGCTVMMAVGKASATGSTVFLKNSDKVGSETYVGATTYKNKEINAALVLNPEGGHKTVGVAAIGVTALKMGLNDRGVAAGCNISRTQELARRQTEKDAIQIKALDRGALLRDGLEKGATAHEAAQTIIPSLLESPMSTPAPV